MKFSCGLERAEHKAKLKAKVNEMTVWELWFAWFPVRVGLHDCRWLEFVERRYIFASVARSYDMLGPYWEITWTNIEYRETTREEQL